MRRGEMPRRVGGAGEAEGRLRKVCSRLPTPAPGQRRPARPASSRSAALARPRTCHGCILKGQVLRIKGSWPKLRTGLGRAATAATAGGGPASVACASRPTPEVTAAADLRFVNPELVVPGPRPSSRPAHSWAWGPAPQFSRDVVSAAPWEFSGHHGGVGWCQRPSEVLFFFL